VNAFPAAGDYYKAVQAPTRCFTVPKLQGAEFVWDSLGPTLARGSSAVVFQAAVEGRPQALRCYIREDASSRDRYSALDAYLARRDLSPYVSGTTWLDGAITVNRLSWPVLTMDWIDGRTLNEYVDFLVAGSNAAALTTLAGRWRELVALLQRSEFAHGDLQHGNVMVDQDGQLRLVDFDGVWIPQLAGLSPPTEFGHPNYQHPLHHVWDRWLDTFSALVIYLSLVALGQEPGLWLALYNSKNLLFAKNDFFPPFTTEAWKQLAALGDPQVDELARKLRECCDPFSASDRSLETILDQPSAAPALQVVPAGQRWWENKPASGPRPAAAAPSRSWPQTPPPGSSLPAPPPLSAPLGMAGTGPMPQLSQQMVRPGDTIWWRLPQAGQAQAPAGPGYPGYPGYHGTAPAAPTPRGYAPRPPVPTPPGPPTPGPPKQGPPMPGPNMPGSSAPATRAQTGPVVGALALALGVILLAIGAASHVSIVVIGGLVAGAWGIWRLVTATGKGKPPGQT
jgi:serine/threonine protein kinase